MLLKVLFLSQDVLHNNCTTVTCCYKKNVFEEVWQQTSLQVQTNDPEHVFNSTWTRAHVLMFYCSNVLISGWMRRGGTLQKTDMI